MSTTQFTFKRYEKKYMLTLQQYQELMLRLKLHMNEDAYGLHTINNVYLDTNSYELIRTSMEKPLYKEKIRLRSYGSGGSDHQTFIEIKKKFNGIVYKRRIAMPLSEAIDYLEHGKQPAESSQILHEIDWFMKRYHPEPKMFIAYDRLALYGKENPQLRVTFDQNIRYRNSELSPSLGSWGTALLPSDAILMEIKIPGAIPIWLSQILTELEIYSSSFSKYGRCYTKHFLETFENEGGRYCA